MPTRNPTDVDRAFGTVRNARYAVVQISPSVVPEFLKVGDVVESVFRQHYIPWIVREVETVEAEVSPGVFKQNQTVIASHPGRSAVRFTWHGQSGLSRYGVAGTVGRSIKFFFAYRPGKTEAPQSDGVPAPEVLPEDVWRYKDRADYRVLFVANTRHESDKHPPVVVYETLRDPTAKWTRPLSDWHRSFTLQSRRT